MEYSPTVAHPFLKCETLVILKEGWTWYPDYRILSVHSQYPALTDSGNICNMHSVEQMRVSN